MLRAALLLTVLAAATPAVACPPRPASSPAMVTHSGPARSGPVRGAANGIAGAGLVRPASRGMAGGGSAPSGGINGALVHRSHQ